MYLGIDRDNVAREVRDLRNEQMVTMTRDEARSLIDLVEDDLGTALDFAQGESQADGRYVVIYIQD